MLRKRSRPVSSGKQTTITDHHNNNNNKINFPSPNSDKSHKPTSIFKDFFLSPTSITSQTLLPNLTHLPNPKPFSPTSPTYQIQNPKIFSWEQSGIGLVLFDDPPQVGPISTSKPSKQRSKLVVFGSHLKIQIPPPPQLPTPPPHASPQSPMEFGIKTPKSSLLGHVFAKSVVQQEEDKKRLSVEEMELSEDYTCVISHGPNPKTTHIFGNCIVKSCCGVASNIASASASSTDVSHGSQPEGFSFLSFCHHCNNKIGQGKDIYMYRGEKAFCSQECRGQEMLFDGIEC